MKTYVLTLSKTFPAKHPRKGEPTNFDAQVLNSVWSAHNMSLRYMKFGIKLHTIRENYALWSKRFEQIDEGKACLSIRYWIGKPYHSKQFEICKLTKEDGIGLQEAYIESVQYGSNGMNLSLMIVGGYNTPPFEPLLWQIQEPIVDGETIAKNDGLSLQDWLPFFNGHDISKPLAIIQFTKFRYNPKLIRI